MSVYGEDDEIVVSGIGGHFPECDTLDELRENLLNGVDMVTDCSPRWEPGTLGVPHRTGKMKSLGKCDAQYFGLIGRQCHALDPITRKVLERTYEAVFDAGLNPSDLAGSNTGVFFGTSILESEMTLMEAKASDAYNILGRNKTMNANRVSYWLDLKGPSFTLDSTWSSGLQALALGFEHVRSGLCEAAIVAAGSSIIHPQFSKHFADLNLLSPEGVSRPFDENADGFARSEAVVVLVLQRLGTAKRNYGTLVGVACEAMNTSPGHLLVPRREEWLQLYREFYERCRVDPSRVAFLEGDGLARQEADSAELEAATEFFCRGRDLSRPLLVGSIKSNLGHAMAAAGLCAVAKVVIAFQTGVMPPNLHFEKANAALAAGKAKVVTEPIRFEGEYVAINSFGFGGTYGHCLVRRPPERETPIAAADPFIPRLVLLSARHEEGLEEMVNKMEELPYSDGCIKLVHDVFSKNIAHHMYRGYTVLPRRERSMRCSEPFQGDKRPVWFIFSGMGSHWATMGKDLMRLPAFKRSVDFCHEVLAKKGLDLWEILTRDDATIFDNIINSFVGITSIQIALFDVLTELGIVPDGIIGHSAGELGAAYADGCLTREEAILSSYSRGKVSSETKVIRGMMAAVGMGYADIKDQLPDEVEVACRNSSASCTISGPSERVDAFARKLKAEGVFVKTVNVSNIPFHSKHIKEMGPRLRDELSQVILHPRRRSGKWISSSVPESRWHEPEWHFCSPNYLTNNLLSPVYFEEACRHVPKNAIAIEIAPHGLLLSVLKRALGQNCISVALTHRNAPDQLIHLLKSLGKLYIAGLQPRVAALYPPVKMPVPSGTPFLGSLATWDHSFLWNCESKAYGISERFSKEFLIHVDEEVLFRSYRLDSEFAVPSSALLMLALQVFSSSRKSDLCETGVTFEDVHFGRTVTLNGTRTLTLSVMTLPGTGKFEVSRGEEVLASGTVKEAHRDLAEENKYLGEVRRPRGKMDGDEMYLELARHGHEYLPPLAALTVTENDGGACWHFDLEWKGQLPNLLESLVQCYLVANPGDFGLLHRPTSIREITVQPELFSAAAAAEVSLGLRLTLNTETGTLMGRGIRAKGLRLKAVAEEAPQPCGGDADGESGMSVLFADAGVGKARTKEVGFSGVDSSGSHVIGLGSWDESFAHFRPDEILSWRISQELDLEEASSMPLPHCLAYYALKLAADAGPRDAVLVTDGASSIGAAFVGVALQYTDLVYVAVSSHQKKESLEEMYPRLGEKILVMEPGREDQMPLEMAAKATERTVDFVINTLPAKFLEKFLPCIADFGHFFQIFPGGDGDGPDDDEALLFSGTENLLRNGRIAGVGPSSVLASSREDKMKLKELLARGLASGAVVPPAQEIPFRRGPARANRVPRGFRAESNDGSSRFTCKPQSSYLVVCDRLQSGLCAAEWFAKRQARKITVLHSDGDATGGARPRANAWRRSTALIVAESDVRDGAAVERVLGESVRFDAAIVLTADEEEVGDSGDRSRIRLERVASDFLRPLAPLIFVSRSDSGAIGFCAERNRSGAPTLAIVCDAPSHPIKLRRAVRLFDQVLARNRGNVIRTSEDVVDEEAIGDAERDVELLDALPRSPSDIARLGDEAGCEPAVAQVQTLSVPFELAKETVPVFLVPGIGGESRLLQLFSRSLYPTFIVRLPHLGPSSIEQLASCLVPRMRFIARGPMVLVGERWGGCVAFETGRQLELLGHRVHVFLLSGTPTEVAEPLRLLSASTESLQVGLLSRLLPLDEEDVRRVSDYKTWRARLNYCSKFADERMRKSLLRGLDRIRWQLEAALGYSPKSPLNGPLTIVSKRSMSFRHYGQLCRRRVDFREARKGDDIPGDDTLKMIHDTSIHRNISAVET